MTSADAGKRWVSKHLLAMISTLKILLCVCACGGRGEFLLFNYEIHFLCQIRHGSLFEIFICQLSVKLFICTHAPVQLQPASVSSDRWEQYCLQGSQKRCSRSYMAIPDFFNISREEKMEISPPTKLNPQRCGRIWSGSLREITRLLKVNSIF